MEERKTAAQLEADRRADAARGDQDAIANGQAPQMVAHIYPDGSSRFGAPPFPEKSPIEEAAEEKRSVANGVVIPPGMKTEGSAVVATGSGISVEEFTEKAQEQLQSDVAAGKSPNVVNPTTASTKPQLAGTDGHVGDAVDLGAGVGDLGDKSAPVDLEKIAADIKPEGDFEATDEQKAAAVAQVAREVGVPVVEDDKAEPAKRGPGRPSSKK